MSFSISAKKIKNAEIALICDSEEWSGVKKIAGRVCDDMKAVFGVEPKVCEAAESLNEAKLRTPILFGTVGKSSLLSNLEKKGLIDLSAVRGKREVYAITVVEKFPKAYVSKGADGEFASAMIIAGSEKRGTVYGLFHLSEMLGVSPFIDWLDMKPAGLESFETETGFCFVSKEPSVRFRGFFINDEWPAFGNFCKKNYGGFTAKAYVHVFELLLRLKGNYLWPAMWSSVFPEDGPGLANAELADEMGVIMGASHHEPCCRQGEEYSHVRGKDSVYGDAWNFLTNEKGITRFWEDGLKRSGRFENVITVGMRGEADTAIMGQEATLADNINLLRKVLKTQNRLIRTYVNRNLDEVPRMLALYKEVEPYFYGDETTPGLMDDPELEGVTLMLCDDNYGNLRTLPTKHMREHKGGYGMYYHFDYHGYPISFEWFNTSFLPKVWEQMTTAYDNGIRDLWIVNVGDIFSNEFPLAYFLDLAYDYERYGSSNLNSAAEYTMAFPEAQFAGLATTAECRKMSELLRGYTKITHNHRAEAINDRTYDAMAYGECETLLSECDRLMKEAEKLKKDISKEAAYGYYELVYLPLMANLNVQKMWLLTSKNHFYAELQSTYAMKLADEIKKCMEFDRALTEELHTTHNGQWYGMGMSEHIGFVNWCEEECRNPVMHTFEPADKERLIVTIPGTSQHTEGGFWSGRILTLGAFLNPSETVGIIELSTASAKPAAFSVECDCAAVKFAKLQGNVKPYELYRLKVTLSRNDISEDTVANVVIHGAPGQNIRIRIPVCVMKQQYEKNTFVYLAEDKVDMSARIHAVPQLSKIFGEGALLNRYISIEAEHFCRKNDTAAGHFEVLADYGRTLSAVKAFPQDKTFSGKEAPSVTYRVAVPCAGRYEMRVLTNPSNPPERTPELWFGVSVNGGRMKKENMIFDGFRVGDGNPGWAQGVLDNIREKTVTVTLNEGVNEISLYALQPGFVLEKLVILPEGEQLKHSLLGPFETWYQK